MCSGSCSPAERFCKALGVRGKALLMCLADEFMAYENDREIGKERICCSVNHLVDKAYQAASCSTFVISSQTIVKRPSPY